jgi:hypothetical protein
MNMSRGTGFVELYIKPFVMKDYDWDVIAEACFGATKYSLHSNAPGCTVEAR